MAQLQTHDLIFFTTVLLTVNNYTNITARAELFLKSKSLPFIIFSCACTIFLVRKLFMFIAIVAPENEGKYINSFLNGSCFSKSVQIGLVFQMDNFQINSKLVL